MLGYIALTVVASGASFLLVWSLIYGGAKFLRGVRNRKIRKDFRETPWKHYSRPSESGDQFWAVGVERVTEDGLVLNRVEMYLFPAPQNSDEVRNAEGHAISNAVQYNDSRVGM